MSTFIAPEPRCRPAAASDEAFLRRLFASTRDAELALLGGDPVLAQHFMAMQYAARERGYRAAHPAAVCRVVECNAGAGAGTEPVGQVWVDFGPAAIDLLDISLLPAWRCQGLGTVLLRGLMTEAEVSERPVRLQVAAGNQAQRLYARLGFQADVADGLHLTMHWQPPAPVTFKPLEETSNEQA